MTNRKPRSTNSQTKNVTGYWSIEGDVYDEHKDPQLVTNQVLTQTDVDVLIFSAMMAKKCFPKCVTDMQHAQLSPQQRLCVAQCADRFFDAENLVAQVLAGADKKDETRKRKPFMVPKPRPFP